jgi:hypothetical protein
MHAFKLTWLVHDAMIEEPTPVQAERNERQNPAGDRYLEPRHCVFDGSLSKNVTPRFVPLGSITEAVNLRPPFHVVSHFGTAEFAPA